MSTLSDRPNTALLVIDVQNGVVGEAHERDQVVANISTLVGKARAGGVPVVWVQHSSENLVKDSDEWQLVPELERDDSEALVHKTYADSFEDTDLEEVLAKAGIGRVVVSGAQTDECIRSTIHGAMVRGYDVTLVGDAHTTEDLSEWGAPTPDLVIAHTNLYWENHQTPGRTAAVQPTKEITFTD
jgi:nicotinamidase-related amidase